MAKRRALILACLVMLSCASVGVTRFSMAPAKPHDCQLEVFETIDEVEHEYDTVCLIDARTGTSAFADKTVAAAIDKARPKACECGADALILISTEQAGSFWEGSEGRAQVRAIRYTDGG